MDLIDFEFLAAFNFSWEWAEIRRVLIWVVVIALVVVGFIGTFIPILPGTTMILAGCCIHYFALGQQASGLTWQGLVVIAIFYVISVIVDYFSGAIGAKWFGSTKWGIIGAIVGGIAGLFFSLPGIIIGPIVGVFVFEMLFAKKKLKDASSSTVGTLVGGLAGMVVRLVLAVLMIACYILDTFVWN